MENKYYVYQHVRLDTLEPFYVGKGKDSRAYSRWGRNKHWYNIVNKVGYSVEIVQDNLTEEEAFNLEIETIANYRKLEYKLCNMTNGGEGVSGCTPSEKTRAKMSASKQNISEETRAKLGAVHKKAVTNNFGEAYDSARSASIATGVTNTNISRCCLGELKSAGTRNGEKIVWVLEENKDTLIQRVLEANNNKTTGKRVTNNFGEYYNSASAAERATQVASTNISLCCNGKLKSAGVRDSQKIVWAFEGDRCNLAQKTIEASQTPSTQPKKIINNFGEIYDSICAAAKHTGVRAAHISGCCNGKRKSAGTYSGEKIVWVFETDKNILEQKTLDAHNSRSAKPRRVSNSIGDVYASISDASVATGITLSSISLCCNGKYKYAGKKDGVKVTWSFI